MSGTVLDTGALIALERGDRTVRVLVAEARRKHATLTVPAGCIAQAWRDPARQARLASFLRSPGVDVVAMGDAEARRVGVLLAAARSSDITDGHVAVCALRLDATVVTGDPEDIRRLGPDLRIHRV